MPKILIIEDDIDINQMLTKLLKLNNYETTSAYNGEDALQKHNQTIDLILLDLMLPKKNGNEIIKELKQIHDTPIIITTAIGEINTKLDLFKLGADDYITKPFNNEELLARIKVHLKHNSTQNKNNLTYKDITIDLNNYTCICNNQPVNLSKTEFDLLTIMMNNPNQVHTKSNLIDNVWNNLDSADDNTLNVHISNLRTKLKKANPQQEYIETIWSIGYKLKK